MFCSIAYTALNDHESAMECYRKALDLDPTNQSYQNNLEIAEQKLKEEAAKVGYCKKIIISSYFSLIGYDFYRKDRNLFQGKQFKSNNTVTRWPDDMQAKNLNILNAF